MLYLVLGCVALCSWLTSFCYPGNCMDGISSCNCSQGFVGDNCLESKHFLKYNNHMPYNYPNRCLLLLKV